MNAVKRAIIWNLAQDRRSECCQCNTPFNLSFVDWVNGEPRLYCRAHAHGMKECQCGARAHKKTSAYDEALDRTTETYWCGSSHCQPDVTTADGQRAYDLRVETVE